VRALAVALLVACACVPGAPPGFSHGESWTFPLVGTLENGQLFAPVFIDDKGPYLFLLDPDSPLSTIDTGILSDVQPYSSIAPRYDDEQDTRHVQHVADIAKIRVGELTVENRGVWVQPIGTFDVGGRHVRGVLGHDVIADSLVFGFDRDTATAFLATHQGFTPVPGATEIGYRILTSHLPDALPVGRRLVTATIGGRSWNLHVDLGGVQNQLREPRWGDAGLAPAPAKDVLIDEIGIKRQVDHGAIAADVALGPLHRRDVKFVPYDDRRWEREDIDGVLGLSFLLPYRVVMDLDRHQLYLTPRAGDLAADVRARLDRWGSRALSSCPHPGCLAIATIPSEDAASGALIRLDRDPQAQELDLELTLELVGKDGAPLGKPLMVVELARGAADTTARLDPSLGPDATLRVVDASPFVRACPNPARACLYTIAQ
jgi:hypothetical protein